MLHNGADADADGHSDAVDNCVSDANPGQENADRNFTDLTPPKGADDLTRPNSDDAGDTCDADDDNDGLADASETGCNGGAPTGQLLADSDGDRRLDGAECANGSDPSDAGSVPATGCTLGSSTDTDHDGMRDALEACFYNTSITLANTDGDACGDAREATSMDANTTVNAADLGLTASAFGAYGTPPVPGNEWRVDMDVDKNGVVNGADLGLVASKFGPCP
jgi:hypothetical protein